MSFYLDASVLVARLLQEATSDAVQKFVVGNAGGLAVSDFAAGEVAAAISKAHRDNRIALPDAMRRISDFDIWRGVTTTDAELLRTDLAAAVLLVRRFNLKLRLPDAIHLACCQRLGLVLVTFDNRMARAGRMLGLAVIKPGIAED